MDLSWLDPKLLVLAAIIYLATEYFKTLLSLKRGSWIRGLAFVLGAALGFGGLQDVGLRLLPAFPAGIGGALLGLFAAILAMGGHMARMNGIQARVNAEAERGATPEESPAPAPDPVVATPPPIVATPVPDPALPDPLPPATDDDLTRWAAPQTPGGTP